jgi:hypothetical protein
MERCHAPYHIQRVDYICQWMEEVICSYLNRPEAQWEDIFFDKRYDSVFCPGRSWTHASLKPASRKENTPEIQCLFITTIFIFLVDYPLFVFIFYRLAYDPVCTQCLLACFRSSCTIFLSMFCCFLFQRSIDWLIFQSIHIHLLSLTTYTYKHVHSLAFLLSCCSYSQTYQFRMRFGWDCVMS